MMLLSIAGAILAAATFAAAVGNASVLNFCSFPVYVWSVGSEVVGPAVLDTTESYTEEYAKDPVTGGKTLKITTDSNGLYDGTPQTDFAYSLDNDQIWYDLSDVFGDAFSGSQLVVGSTNTSCPQIVWSAGTPPAGSQTKVCGSDNDVTLTLCA
jgi:hypothetical protein